MFRMQLNLRLLIIINFLSFFLLEQFFMKERKYAKVKTLEYFYCYN